MRADAYSGRVPDLVVNTDSLRGLARNLGSVHRTLTSAEGDARDVAGMIPHAGLSGAVHSFTADWDRRRRDLADQVEQLQQRTSGAADAFEGVDQQLGDKLTEGGNG